MEWLATLPHCYLYGKPYLALASIVGNASIGIAYFTIPCVIEYVRRKRDMPFTSLAFLFSAFIILCGSGHLLDIMTMLSGGDWYWAEAAIALLTGIVSLGTAIYAGLLIPKLLRIPTIAHYETLLEALSIYRKDYLWRQSGKPLPAQEEWQQ